MRYSLNPHDRRYIQGQGFMCFARNIGNKYGRKIFDKILPAKALGSAVDVGKSIKKYGKKILDNSLSAGKIVDRITKSARNKEQEEDDRIMEETQEIIIPSEKREQIIRDLKLFPL